MTVRVLLAIAIVIGSYASHAVAESVSLRPITATSGAADVDTNFKALAEAISKLQRDIAAVGQTYVLQQTAKAAAADRVYAPVVSGTLSLPAGSWSVALIGMATVPANSGLKIKVNGTVDAVEWGRTAGSALRMTLLKNVPSGTHVVEVLGMCTAANCAIDTVEILAARGESDRPHQASAVVE